MYWKGKSLLAMSSRLGLSAVIFHVYRKRNAILLGNKVSSEEQLVAVIRKNVKVRIQFKGPSLILEICRFTMDGKLHHN